MKNTFKEHVNPGDVIIHGMCRGADMMADRLCNNVLGNTTIRYPAKWELHGKSAGILRNLEMIKGLTKVKVLAFHQDVFNSRGTGHMVNTAVSLGMPTFYTQESTGICMYLNDIWNRGL